MGKDWQQMEQVQVNTKPVLESSWFKSLGFRCHKGQNIDNNASISHYLDGHQWMSIFLFFEN